MSKAENKKKLATYINKKIIKLEEELRIHKIFRDIESDKIYYIKEYHNDSYLDYIVKVEKYNKRSIKFKILTSTAEFMSRNNKMCFLSISLDPRYYAYRILLEDERPEFTEIQLSDLPLYMGWRYVSAEFAELIKNGRKNFDKKEKK